MKAVDCGSGAGEASTSLYYEVWIASCVNWKVFLGMSWSGLTLILRDAFVPCLQLTDSQWVHGQRCRVQLAPVVKGGMWTLSLLLRLRHPCRSALRRSTIQWTLGNAQGLLHKAGQLTYSSRSCLSKGISSCGRAIRFPSASSRGTWEGRSDPGCSSPPGHSL